jgi:hypothetical protein
MMDSYLFEITRIKNRNAFFISLIDTVERATVSSSIPPRQHDITMVNQSGIPHIISLCGDFRGCESNGDAFSVSIKVFPKLSVEPCERVSTHTARSEFIYLM